MKGKTLTQEQNTLLERAQWQESIMGESLPVSTTGLGVARALQERGLVEIVSREGGEYLKVTEVGRQLLRDAQQEPSQLFYEETPWERSQRLRDHAKRVVFGQLGKRPVGEGRS